MWYVLIFITEQMLLGGCIIIHQSLMKSTPKSCVKEVSSPTLHLSAPVSGINLSLQMCIFILPQCDCYFILNLQVCVSERECENDKGWRNLKLTWMCPMCKAIKTVPHKAAFYL